MDERFFSNPILNSPYEYPGEHWELDEQGQPTQKTVPGRRSPRFITPIPRPKRQGGKQTALVFDEGKGLSTEDQQYELASVISELRAHVDRWRERSNPSTWQVTPETARLLQYWRHHAFDGPRPFFCQIEAVETVIWLTEVAPRAREGKRFLDHLARANAAANPDLMRVALKLATGAGKTTVMAMLIAWQTINAERHRQSKRFTRGFLVVTPGLTILDRLRVLLPSDPGNLYATRQLVPSDLLADVRSAKVVVTNYHAFKLRERLELSRVGRALLEGHGPALQTLETPGQMLQRVMPELMGLKNILVLNDEAHHCYREKPDTPSDDELKGDEKKEAEKNAEAARVWITGLETVQNKLGIARVIDLSATPFFLGGSGYTEGTLFPWTMSDFSLMDAIECGIVKLPRVPVSDNIPGGQMPMFRNLWDHIGKKLPKGGKGKKEALDPADLPPQLQTALDALYGHYVKTFDAWRAENISVPPCFIVVCNNTATSKLVYDYISGFLRDNEDGSQTLIPGRLELFRNFDEHGNALARPNAILIDSRQLESGEGFDPNFRKVAAPEIDRFRREALERGGALADELRADKDIGEARLLREVMNTVGKSGSLGESIRCVVSVSMLTEGWDANTVTHVLGVRAFGTQLLCEQVIGRALRRQSYDLNERGLFDVEYADVLGVPFDFTAQPVVVSPQRPRETILVKAIRPDRDAAEIRFPRVEGYRVELPTDHVTATFNEDSVLRLTPALIGATSTQNAGIIGEAADLTLAHTGDVRPSQIVYELTAYLVSRWRSGEAPQSYLFNQLKRVTREWLDGYLKCEGGTYAAQLRYKTLADAACNKIIAGINVNLVGERAIKALLDPYTPTGTTASVNFTTSKTLRWQTDPRRCHLNWAILDSDWETEFCRVAELHPRVRAYVKNHSLGFEVPYRFGSEVRRYRPDFIVRLEDGHGEDDLLNLIVEIKGYRGEDAKDKKMTMDTYWIPGVNNLGTHGRWAFAEFRQFPDGSQFRGKVESEVSYDAIAAKALV
ncbi:MAG: DEAD/DEAH box helicase family protein [Candidatus Eremiobacteraeota bacterium]|nr:DEAD/DEAH box helicase family protein [Candidatus Eremiobacteraeota bacterium]